MISSKASEESHIWPSLNFEDFGSRLARASRIADTSYSWESSMFEKNALRALMRSESEACGFVTENARMNS